jgi:hypothetical protein
MTLLTPDATQPEIELYCSLKPCPAARPEEKAGYGLCTACICLGYYNNGTGVCRCGHSFGQHSP